MAQFILMTGRETRYLAGEEVERELSVLLHRKEVFWLDVGDPGGEEVSLLQRLFAFLPVAAEEVRRPSQLPRVEIYGDHLLLVWHAVRVEPQARVPMRRIELECFLGKTYLVTVHVSPVESLKALRRRFAALDHLADRVAVLEERVLAGKIRNPTREITALRRALVRLRHGIGPEQQVLGDLVRRAPTLIGETTAPLFRQAAERLSRLWEGIELERDMVDNVLEVYLGLRTDRLNLVMQRLTLITTTTIFMPLTLIAGIYGMNFRHMPELSWRYGYPTALAAMVAVGYGMYRWFRARGWFGEP